MNDETKPSGLARAKAAAIALAGGGFPLDLRQAKRDLVDGIHELHVLSAILWKKIRGKDLTAAEEAMLEQHASEVEAEAKAAGAALQDLLSRRASGQKLSDRELATLRAHDEAQSPAVATGKAL